MSSVLIVASRVWQTTATTGTGDISFDASVPTGYRSFVSAIGNGNFCPYVIDDGQGNWEIGLGTISSGTPDSMARTTVKSNSLGTTAKINFGSGTKTVKCVPTGSSYVYLNSAPTTDQILIASSSGGMDPISIAAYFKKLLTTDGDIAQNVSGTVSRRTPTQVVQSLDPVREMFSAYQAADQSNITGDGTNVQIGSWTELYDVGSNFNASTGLFTAPANGIFIGLCGMSVKALTSSHNDLLVVGKSSNGAITYGIELNPSGAKTGGNLIGAACCFGFGLAAGDTAYIQLAVTGGTKVAGIQGGAAGVGRTWFSGVFLRT